MKKEARGFGKIILLGEHFVVHNLPALVVALDLYTTATLRQRSDASFVVEDNRFKVPDFKSTKKELYEKMIQTIFEIMDVSTAGWSVELGGSLPVTSGGIGASAATAVAVTRALDQAFGLNLDDEKINQAAWYGEHVIHGTPSGIDNTAATYGGIFVYQRALQENNFYKQDFALHNQLYLVIVDSGRTTNIRQILSAVAAMKVQRPEILDKIFKKYAELFSKGIDAFERCDLITFGRVMFENHCLFQEMGLSSPELDFLIDRASVAGALGAKMTGTGCGGIVVVLADSVASQLRLMNEFESHGFYSLPTVIGSSMHERFVQPQV